ncbi:JAB domain-containing protein [Sphingomonas sp. FW199]|uniref:JAB domain-containing protein n=1 Tax=Sphingomonas sp. FW199 TaxID=3400217 RepID=UPI003CFACDA7
MIDMHGTLGAVFVDAKAGLWPAWAIHTLETVRSIVLSCLQARVFDGKPLVDHAALHAYLTAELAYRPQEEVWGIFLDTDLRAVSQHCFSIGGYTMARIEPRQVIRCALLANAAGVILVHNHPGGRRQFSMADVATTRLMIDVLGPLCVTVHEHILITRSGCLSMRQSNPELWP